MGSLGRSEIYREALQDFLQPHEENIEHLILKHDALLDDLASIQTHFSEAKQHGGAMLGHLLKAFDLSLKPPSMLLAANSCPSIDRAAQQAHESHLKIAAVLDHVRRWDASDEDQILGLVGKMDNTIDNATREMKTRLDNVIQRRQRALEEGDEAAMLRWSNEKENYKTA